MYISRVKQHSNIAQSRSANIFLFISFNTHPHFAISIIYTTFEPDRTQLPSATYLIKEALCLLLVSEKPRKLQSPRKQEVDIIDSAHTRGAVIPTSVFKGFPSTFTLGRGQTVPRFFFKSGCIMILENVWYICPFVKDSLPNGIVYGDTDATECIRNGFFKEILK